MSLSIDQQHLIQIIIDPLRSQLNLDPARRLYETHGHGFFAYVEAFGEAMLAPDLTSVQRDKVVDAVAGFIATPVYNRIAKQKAQRLPLVDYAVRGLISDVLSESNHQTLLTAVCGFRQPHSSVLSLKETNCGPPHSDVFENKSDRFAILGTYLSSHTARPDEIDTYLPLITACFQRNARPFILSRDLMTMFLRQFGTLLTKKHIDVKHKQSIVDTLVDGFICNGGHHYKNAIHTDAATTLGTAVRQMHVKLDQIEPRVRNLVTLANPVRSAAFKTFYHGMTPDGNDNMWDFRVPGCQEQHLATLTTALRYFVTAAGLKNVKSDWINSRNDIENSPVIVVDPGSRKHAMVATPDLTQTLGESVASSLRDPDDDPRLYHIADHLEAAFANKTPNAKNERLFKQYREFLPDALWSEDADKVLTHLTSYKPIDCRLG